MKDRYDCIAVLFKYAVVIVVYVLRSSGDKLVREGSSTVGSCSKSLGQSLWIKSASVLLHGEIVTYCPQIAH
jgi:hypothetical protein